MPGEGRMSWHCPKCGAEYGNPDVLFVTATGVCHPCTRKPQWGPEQEMAYQWLRTWFFGLYEDPIESCPYDSGEGGYQWIFGGPYTAEEALLADWEGIFTEEFLERVADLLCE